MPDQINTEYVAETARKAVEEEFSEMQEVHGPLWESRENLAKLIMSLSSGILVGTITFSGGLIGSTGGKATCPILVMVNWSLLFIALASGIVSLWFSTNLISFRVRLTNAEPDLVESAGKLDPNLPPETLQEELVKLLTAYAKVGSEPVGRADAGARHALVIS